MNDVLRILFFLLVVRPLLLIMLGMNVFGRQHLPRQRQFIIVANHNSHWDAVALMSLFPLHAIQRIHPVAAEDYFCKSPLLAWFSTACMNIIPIPRCHISRDNNPLQRMCAALQAGDSLIIFPEGSRGKPEEMAPFQSGVAHLIQKFPDIPVVPVYLKGMGRSLPKGEWLPVPFFCDVHIGRPLVCSGTKEAIIHMLEAAMHDLEQSLPMVIDSA